MIIRHSMAPFLLVLLLFASAQAADKPKLTLDEFFNAVEITGVKISPDGHSVVIATDRADWEQSIFRDDLWLYRDDSHGGGSLTQLTQSGYDSQPQWSPECWENLPRSKRGPRGLATLPDLARRR